MATILLVDDDPQTRNVLKRRLTFEGYQVIEAEDAERAIERYRETMPDIVMADLRLPGASGEALIEDLRRADTAVRVIAISGAPERLAALQAGRPVRTLVKPFTSEQLLEALGGVMQPPTLWSKIRRWFRTPA